MLSTSVQRDQADRQAARGGRALELRARRIRLRAAARRIEHHEREGPISVPDAASGGADRLLHRLAVEHHLRFPARSGGVGLQVLRRVGHDRRRAPDRRPPRGARSRAPAPGASPPAARSRSARRRPLRRRARAGRPTRSGAAHSRRRARLSSKARARRFAASDFETGRVIVCIGYATARSDGYNTIGAAPYGAHPGCLEAS